MSYGGGELLDKMTKGALSIVDPTVYDEEEGEEREERGRERREGGVVGKKGGELIEKGLGELFEGYGGAGHMKELGRVGGRRKLKVQGFFLLPFFYLFIYSYYSYFPPPLLTRFFLLLSTEHRNYKNMIF